MKTMIVKRKLTEAEGNKLQGTFLANDAYDTLLTEDADVYNPEGELLLKFRKSAIPLELLRSGYEAFRDSIGITLMRKIASGHSENHIRKDGVVSNTRVGAPVESSVVGYVDQSRKMPFCRKTAFTKAHFDTFSQGVPFVQHVDKLYAELCPEHYSKQISISRATNINYRIADTSFTTVTVNRNFRTAVHKDAGDLPGGFGNLAVYREGEYDGLYFCLPEYGIAVDMQNTDLLFCDVHRWHGNTPLLSEVPGWMRVSFVMYYREYMVTCKAPAAELARVKTDRGGFMKL